MPPNSDVDAPTFKNFYAWQSDLPSKTNRRAILNALNEAAEILETEFGGRILIDEATRDVSGSPYIPGKIVEKIKSADAFVADLSTVVRDQSGKKAANSNVIFELGYAAAHVGWDRIILLINSEYGPVEDLPFDIDRHRASPYTFSSKLAGTEKKSAKAHLRNLVEVAIRAIVQSEPKKPAELDGLSSDAIKRERDLRQIRLILSQISLTQLDKFIEDIPHQIDTNILHFWTNFHAVLVDSRFHLCDTEIRKAICKLRNAWEIVLSYDRHYRETSHEDLQIFGSQGAHSRAEQKAWAKIASKRVVVYQELKHVLEILRERYIEIDVNETSELAWKEFVSYRRSIK